MATINLAEKYSKKLALPFTQTSLIAGKSNTDYDFDGVRSVNIYTPVTVELQDYDRTATNKSRFGDLVEMGDTIQTLVVTQEKSFNVAIDKGNQSDQLMIKRAGNMMSRQIAEQVVPAIDKYALSKWAEGAGSTIATGSMSKSNIAGKLLDVAAAFDNAYVPKRGRYLYLTVTNSYLLMLSSDFVRVADTGRALLSGGVIGSYGGFEVVTVPDSWLPEGVEYLATYKQAVLQPTKLKTARILTDDYHVDGAILQGHWYYDAFVLEAMKQGVIVGKTAAA